MTANRAWWDERAALHGQDVVYDTAAFLAGEVQLRAVERQVVGDVTGESLVHLQCHLGYGTLSWLRLGASAVTGVDFSPVAIERARSLAGTVGLADRATFVESDVLDVPSRLHGRADVCFASFGVISWIADITGWMRTAAAVLRPGGRLGLVDAHPLWQMVASLDPLALDFPYADDGPRRFEAAGSYAVPDAVTTHNVTYEHGHSLGELVTAAVEAGLVVDRLEEHLAVETDCGRGLLRPEQDGALRWRIDGQPLPVLFSLQAHRPG